MLHALKSCGEEIVKKHRKNMSKKCIGIIGKFTVFLEVMIYLHGNSMFSWPTAGQGQVSIGHRSLLQNDYFVNCFRLEPRKCSS